MCCVALLTLTIGEAAADVSGNDYRGYADSVRMIYVVAVLDAWGFVVGGIRSSKTVKAPEIDFVFGDIVRCVERRRMLPEQVTAIVDKYMRENPVKGDEGMPGLIWSALNQACPK
jgi:hypothetical protein